MAKPGRKAKKSFLASRWTWAAVFTALLAAGIYSLQQVFITILVSKLFKQTVTR